MKPITNSPNRKEKTIFFATDANQYQELITFVGSLKMPMTRERKVTITFKIEKNFVECNIEISEEEFENVCAQLVEKAEVRYVIEPYEEYND